MRSNRLTPERSRAFAESYLNTMDADFVKRVDHQRASRWAAELITHERSDLNDVETIAARLERNKEHFQEITADVFAERVTDSGATSCISGIRFVNGDPAAPFVDVLPAELPRSLADLTEIRELVLTLYASFCPRHFQLWLPPGHQIQGAQQEPESGRRIIAAFLDDITSTDAHSGVITLVPVESADYYDWYAAIYQEFHEQHPELRNWVPVNDMESMELCREQGLLFRALSDGTPCGLIAGEELLFLGEKSLYMNEIVVDGAHKGTGLASEIQRLFLERTRDRFDIVWGTIDAKNLPSTKTAIRNGRRSISEELFFPI